MSNGDWIDRVRSTRPEDYSSGDLGKLRDETRRSPEVRKALADEIRLDQALHASTGRSPLSTGKIVAAATAAAAATAGGGLAGTILSWLSVLVVTSAVGVVTVLVLPGPGAGPAPEIVSPAPGSEPQPPVEKIDPLQDPRYVTDDSSPSDKPPPAATPGDLPPEFAKSPSEKPSGPDKLPGVKAPRERDDSAGPSRGVTQK